MPLAKNPPSQPAIQPPHQPDPIAALKQIVATIPKGQRKRPEEKMRKMHAGNTYYVGERLDEELNTLYDYVADSYDVEKTTSLVSPFTGYLVIDEYYQPPGEPRNYSLSYKATFSFQDGQWVLKDVVRGNKQASTAGWRQLIGDTSPLYLEMLMEAMLPGQPIPGI